MGLERFMSTPAPTESSAKRPELAIKTIHLNLWYGDFQALYDINFDVKNGIITALIGPSGCGKSTTLRMVAGLEEISDGEIHIEGQLVNDVAPKATPKRKKPLSVKWVGSPI